MKLLTAALEGNLKDAIAFVNKASSKDKLDLNAKDEKSGDTSLHLAAEAGFKVLIFRIFLISLLGICSIFDK